ncbi:hypothetical protein HDU67_000541 [Dinochytrium kinnereticum]|nr:hypothetical protein HDU67_000541 [Dinochytrium kinnereticum]
MKIIFLTLTLAVLSLTNPQKVLSVPPSASVSPVTSVIIAPLSNPTAPAHIPLTVAGSKKHHVVAPKKRHCKKRDDDDGKDRIRIKIGGRRRRRFRKDHDERVFGRILGGDHGKDTFFENGRGDFFEDGKRTGEFGTFGASVAASNEEQEASAAGSSYDDCDNDHDRKRGADILIRDRDNDDRFDRDRSFGDIY